MKKIFTLATSILTLMISFSTSLTWAAAPAVVKIELSTGTANNKEAMVFSKDRLMAKAGSHVSIVYKNGAAVKGTVYNFVLVKPGTAQSMVDASVSAGADKGWVAERAEIIAKSKLVDAGETVTIEFVVPMEPGDYPYICTVPGHATMKGLLKVTR